MPIPFQSHVIVGAAALVAGGFLAWQVQGWRWDASLKDATEDARVAQERAIVDHDIKQRMWEKERAALTTRANTAAMELADVQARVVTRIVYRDKVMPNGETCPDPRIGADVFSVFNDSASAADRAVPREAD